MPNIKILVNEEIDASEVRLFTLYDVDNVTELAAIDWLGIVEGESIHSPCITILKDGVTINYDGAFIANAVDNINGTPSIAPSFSWYMQHAGVPVGHMQNRNNGERFFFATPENPSGVSYHGLKYRSLYGDNSSLRLSNLNAWNDATMRGACMDMRIGMNYSSAGTRVLVAQAAIDTLNY